jgi:hypothetical protein
MSSRNNQLENGKELLRYQLFMKLYHDSSRKDQSLFVAPGSQRVGMPVKNSNTMQ